MLFQNKENFKEKIIQLRIDFKQKDIAQRLLILGLKEGALDKREIEERLNALRNMSPK